LGQIFKNIMETKRIYTAPQVELILIDNEIALALESAPPAGPSETFNSVQSPFKQNTDLA